MNKRVGSSKYLSSKDEDKDIKDIAYASTINSRYVFGMVIFAAAMFLVTIMFSLDYYTKMNTDAYKIIELKKNNNKVFITSNGSINETIHPNLFNKKGEYTVIREASIELVADKSEKEDPIIDFDIKYSILENTFKRNGTATNDSDVVVRFSYSYDNKEWVYINNAIRTNESAVTPLMGSYFDVAGLIGELNVSTDNTLKAKIGESVIMYWRCETLFQNINNKELSGTFKADFSIDFKE